MHTDIAELVGTDVLGGALQGRHACAKLSELARNPPDNPTPWFWDFKGVKVASASFMRECFVALQAILRAQRSTLYPVIANANPDVREDLRVTYKDVGTAIVICRLDGRGAPAMSVSSAILNPMPKPPSPWWSSAARQTRGSSPTPSPTAPGSV